MDCWGSVEEFIAAPAWANGVHVVMLPSGAHIDLMLRGDFEAIPPDRGVPVVLSGAVSKREGLPGPFFSGIGLGQSLDSPVVAISDPTLTVDSMLQLAGTQVAPARTSRRVSSPCSRPCSDASSALCCWQVDQEPGLRAWPSGHDLMCLRRQWCGIRRPTSSTTSRNLSSIISASRSRWSGNAS